MARVCGYYIVESESLTSMLSAGASFLCRHIDVMVLRLVARLSGTLVVCQMDGLVHRGIEIY